MPVLLLNKIVLKWFFRDRSSPEYYSPRVSFQDGKKVIAQKTVDKCNNNCIFCVVPDCFSEYEKEHQAPETLEFIKIIDSYSEDGRNPDTIAYTTAEPTLRSDIIYLLEYTTKKYPDAEIKLLTNGRMFRHRKYAERYRNLFKQIEFDIPLHGHTGDIHDNLTLVRRSFEQTEQGIRNIFDIFPAAKVNIRILVHKMNYQHLEAMIDFIIRNFPNVNSIILIYISMIGDATVNYNKLFLRFQDLRLPLNSVLKKFHNKVPLLLFHFPYCIIESEFWDINPGRTLSEEQIEFPRKCSECLMRDKCCGFWKSKFNKELFEGVILIKKVQFSHESS